MGAADSPPKELPRLCVAVVTTLYPSVSRPREGVFAERRWQRMRARGHDIFVVHPQPIAPPSWLPLLPRSWRETGSMPAHEDRSGIEVVRPRFLNLPGRGRGNAQRCARAADRALAGRGFDLAVIDYAWPAAVLAPRLAARGVPCVINGRGSDVLQVAEVEELRPLLAEGLAAAGSWCAVSQDLVDAMDALGGAEGRGALVPNGVEPTLFHPRDREQSRRAVGFEDGGRIVLVVGHLIPRKDPALAVAAFDEAGLEDARLVFVGDGPSEAELRAEVEQRGLTGRVSLVGSVSPERLAEFYGAADVLLLTSSREGRPNVVLEALASGRPVVATRAGGTAEIVPDERMIVDERDPAAIGACLRETLAREQDPHALSAHVVPLSWEASSATLERVLRDAIESRRSATTPEGGAA